MYGHDMFAAEVGEASAEQDEAAHNDERSCVPGYCPQVSNVKGT